MDEAALLAAIVAAPEDDAPRLVYADWLMQRGDPWGELIVAQCELSRYQTPRRRWDERAHALIARIDELQPARFPEDGIVRNFDRGFCTEIDLRTGDLAVITGPEYALLDSIIARTTPAKLDALAHWPRLGELAKLRIASEADAPPIREPALRVVEAARSIRHLSLSRVDVTRADLEAIFALPQAARLQTFEVTANDSLAGAVGDLRWPHLEALDVAACQLRRSDIAELLANETLRGLRELDISFNSIHDPELAHVLARVPWSRLERLGLLGNPIGADGIDRLAASPALKTLTQLALGADDNDDIAAALPVFATAFPALTRLQLRSGLPTPGLPAIARPYEQLDFELQQIDPDELAALLAHPALANLRSMWISTRRYGDPTDEDAVRGAGIAAALAAAPLHELGFLFIDQCHLGEAGARALARATHLAREIDLTFFDEDFGDARPELIARFPYLSVY